MNARLAFLFEGKARRVEGIAPKQLAIIGGLC